MPNPRTEIEYIEPIVKEVEDTVDDGFGFLDEPLQEFDEPELQDEFADIEFLGGEEASEASYKPDGRTARKRANGYVRMANKGIAALASVYSGAPAENFTIDKEDEEELAKPLAEIIKTNKAMDLPPGWMLVITALIIYFPIVLNAISLRKEKKKAEKEEKERKELENKLLKEKKESPEVQKVDISNKEVIDNNKK